MENYINALREVEKEDSDFELSLSKNEVLDIVNEFDRLNNIIDELKWKPIEQYEKPKYDWVLVKYYIEPNFECIPAVAEKRFGKWYNRNDEEIIGDVRYFMDMQQLDKLKNKKEGNKNV